MAKTYKLSEESEIDWKDSMVEVKETFSNTNKINKSYNTLESDIAMLNETKGNIDSQIASLEAELAEVKKLAEK